LKIQSIDSHTKHEQSVGHRDASRESSRPERLRSSAASLADWARGGLGWLCAMGRARQTGGNAAEREEKRRRRFVSMHVQFESVATSRCERRWVEKRRDGVETHVVRLVGGGLLRWPRWYEKGE
jgi:hypothetical protein